MPLPYRQSEPPADRPEPAAGEPIRGQDKDKSSTASICGDINSTDDSLRAHMSYLSL